MGAVSVSYLFAQRNIVYSKVGHVVLDEELKNILLSVCQNEYDDDMTLGRICSTL